MRAVIVFSAAVLGYCSFAGTAPSSNPAIKAGQKLYVNKCAKCHELYKPENYDEKTWNAWMEKMKKKAKLKPDQYDLLMQYAQARRSDVTAKEKH